MIQGMAIRDAVVGTNSTILWFLRPVICRLMSKICARRKGVFHHVMHQP